MSIHFSRNHLLLLIASTLTSLVPAAARAQMSPPGEAARVTIAGGFGAVNSFHGDLPFIAPAWEASVRVRLGRSAALEVGAARWWHTEEEVLINQPILGPAGPIGTIDRIERRTRHSRSSVEVNLLATGVMARVTMWGGGGVGLIDQSRVFTQVVTGCQLPVPTTCEDFENTHSIGDAVFLGSGGADVRIAGPLALYGAVRLGIPTRDIGSGELRFIVGARLGL